MSISIIYYGTIDFRKSTFHNDRELTKHPWREYMLLELTLNSDGSHLDFAFGKVIKGREIQVFQDYSPAIAPALIDWGIQPLLPFAVLATNTSGPTPEQGAFTQVSSTENFVRFHSDPRFLELKPLRDDGMEFLTDGNLFESKNMAISLESETDYAVIITADNLYSTAPLLKLSAAEDSPNQTYAGKSLALHVWNEKAEELMKAGQAEVFRIRFFPK